MIRLMFTSGTEAGPKGVMLSSRSLISQYLTSTVSGGMTSDDVDLHIMPLYHCAQLDVFLAPDIMLGCTSVIEPSGGTARILKAIELHGVTKLFATPSKWIELLHSPAFDPKRLSKLTKGYYGASAMPVAVLRELAERLPALRLWNFYGQTEMSPSATILPPEDQLTHPGSAGVPGLNVEMAVLGPNNEILDDDEVGEIAFRSPQACLGYWRDEAGTARLFAGGWLHTGDRGYRATSGRLYFVDRVKDTVNVGGEKVASREVEEALYQLPQIQEAAVFGVPDSRFGEAVTAAVVAKPGMTVDPASVRAALRGQLAGFKTPRHVVVLDALPKNASGKVLKRDLREQFASLGTSV
jgi:fatty-acyl-CoA synthase